MKPWPVAPLLFLLSAVPHAQEPELKNWYNDPFFALSQGFADCPVPLGPFMTRAQPIEQGKDVGAVRAARHKDKCSAAQAFGSPPGENPLRPRVRLRCRS